MLKTPVAAVRPEAGAPKAPLSRRALFKRMLGVGAVAAASGAWGRQIEPFWVDWHDVAMPVQGLPKSFEGYRITQLTDLHAGSEVPIDYLIDVIHKVVLRKPDLVVVTGDLVNHTLTAVGPVCEALSQLPRAGIPTIATFGNHDYEVEGELAHAGGLPTRIAEALEARLKHVDIPVLRNRAQAIQKGSDRVWIVGLEDLYSSHYSPQVAFAGLPAGEPIIALSHNPDTAPELDTFGVRWILSGHTHGGQVRVPGVGALVLNIQTPEFQQGHVKLPNSHLYVSRGVGYLKRIRVFCRPEVPTFVMKCDDATV